LDIGLYRANIQVLLSTSITVTIVIRYVDRTNR
jgi:hypothetical protein